ncbi:MAG: pyridoxal phosphate-dependent aminotransferase [Chitinophagaceae bacterium]|nr:pyridoxal phosphate-dependent aminotransferase [Chitinophagaceae bacterium]
MPFISKKVNALAESATLAMAKKARELKALGLDIINLSLGEPDFKTPQYIQKGAIESIQSEKFFSYPPVAGYQDLRELIANKFTKENNIQSTAENIVISNGAKQCIYNLICSVVDPGDEVIIFAPYWVSYADIVEFCGGKPILVRGSIENRYKPTADELQAHITPKTKALLYSSPCNPTGSVFSKEELQTFVEVLKKYPNIWIFADEIYEHINFVGKNYSIGSFEEVKDRTATINGMSKGFAMTGWRLGYLTAPKYLALACEKVQGQVTSAASSISQRAAFVALSSTELTETKKMRYIYAKRRDLVLEMLNDIPNLKTYIPDGAFYIFPDISAFLHKTDGTTFIKNADELSIYLLEKGLVSLVSGTAFGSETSIRISYAASEKDLIEACTRIKKTLFHLK